MVLDLTGVTSFTDFFVIVTGSNSPQVKAISDEIGFQLKQRGEMPVSLEGHDQAEWILADGLSVRLGLQLHKFIWDPAMKGV